MIEINARSFDSDKILLNGSFTLEYKKNGLPENPSEVLKHIVLVVTRAANYQAVTPFREVVVFPDDVKVEGELCTGFFNINVMDHISFDGPGDYYLLCSVGTHLSNSEKCSLS